MEGKLTRLCWSAAIASCVSLLWIGTSPALATTAVSGQHDSNASLVIDPSTNPTDPFTNNIALTAATVDFIQRMPVTKVVNQVTIGDIALADSCTKPSRTQLYVREHTGEDDLGGDYQSSTQIAYSNDYISLPSTLSQVTYAIPPTTFRKGKGYSFVIDANYSGSDCKLAKRTTWAHNGSQVNAGPALCAGAPASKRMWHVNGVDDAIFACVTQGEPFRKFKPSMPGGWLVSILSSTWDIMGGTYSTESPGPDACTTESSANPHTLGATPVFWQFPPGSEITKEYICRWTQFAPHGAKVTDGWYYAQPWLTERAGAPRDMYLKLDTINYDALLAARVPILRYDTDEDFHALSVGAATDFYDASDNPDDPDDANRLVGMNGVFASANPWIAFDQGLDALDIDYLGAAYVGSGPRGGTQSASTDYLDERGDGHWGPFFSSDGFAADASSMEALTGYANRVYGRVAHGSDGKLWLQYWLFYYFDSQGDLGQHVHEGDWEMIQVGLGAGNSPDIVAYAQHGEGERCDWATEVDTVSGRPVVYVAQGSHASYVRDGHYDDPDPDDDANGQGIEVVNPTLVQVRSENPSWVAWPGQWGGSDEDSPPGPAYQPDSKWSDPTTWASGLHDCDAS